MSSSKGILPNKKRPLFFISLNNTSNSSINDNFNISYILPSETIWPWCDYWKEPQHILMQLAQICFLIGYLSYTNTKGVIIMRIFIIIGMILMSFWSWYIICAPDVFVWSCILNVMNCCQVIYSIYKMRPVKFNSEFEDLYNVLFAPFKVSRTRFKRMISNEYATVSTLYSGDAYATQNLTKTNKLSLLISGKVNVYTNNQLLHNILPYEFLDSPEFETSGSNYDEKFKVTIVAVTTCRFICWQREILEYLFAKEPYIATVLYTLIARDISSKLYTMNNKFISSNNNKYIDIRLPSVSSMLSTINNELLVENKDIKCGNYVQNVTEFGNNYECREWTVTQHNIYHTSNVFFVLAFTIPSTFKQSILIIRILLTIGYIFAIVWTATEVCALDILIWVIILTAVNLIYTVFLCYKFIPPTFTMEIADLYAKVFRPLKVSQKHFKELVESGRILTLNVGNVYAAENITPANKYLSIVLKGRLKVTYNNFHLHYVYFHQFIDSPEWEANYNNTMDDYLFQVSIVAEEESAYLCWQRSKLEKVLKHRPALNFVFRNIVGKDITHKLYCLHENITKSKYDHTSALNRKNELLPRDKYKSQSLDAVNTNFQGHVRLKSVRNHN